MSINELIKQAQEERSLKKSLNETIKQGNEDQEDIRLNENILFPKIERDIIEELKEIKINSIPKSISGKNEIKNMLEDINNKLDGKIINDDKKKTTNTKKNKEFDSDDEFIKIGNTRKGGFEK
jgi:hypothetical protein